MASVELVSLTKKYDPKAPPAVDAVDLQINDGEFVVLVGPSGCGKSTALRMVAGLEDVTSGQVRIDGNVVNDVAPQHRDIAMVFQNYALYPHMTVAKNMAYPLKIAGLSGDEIRQRVRSTAEVLQLSDFLDRKPGQLSGGQRQRVAMGRALIREPKVFLMDEPLSNLDAKLRVYMRAEIARIQRSLGVTTLYVTHDQVEAMTMGDRVVVLNTGVLQQADAPQMLYDHPDNLFVAGFIGSPAMNLFSATLDLATGCSLRVGNQQLEMSTESLARRPRLRDYAGQRVVAGIRPEDVHDVAVDRQYHARLNASVVIVEALGSELVVHLDLGIDRVVSGDPDIDELGTGDDKARHEFVARFTPRSHVQPGAAIEVGIDTAKIHFFDADTGAAIRG